MTSAYHAQYWAHALTLRGAADSVDGLSRALSNARVDLNPHQVDAALFAVRSPLSRGAILADEVGLGKTIEAALVIAQRWAERRRRVLVIVPATLRSQWAGELESKFFLPALVLDAGSAARAQAEGLRNPFDRGERVVICSLQYAARRQEQIAAVAWDLVVIDEAHRLRNVYKPGAKVAAAVVAATAGRHKLLLTATPLQNSLMELYGLVSIIDPQVFGDAASFRAQFVRADDPAQRDRLLRLRLADVCQRTLRRQVHEYVRFPPRRPLTQDFSPTDAEQALYEQVSAYLQRPALYALPQKQRALMAMVLRKLLASSSFAIAGTLRVLRDRLAGLQAEQIEAAVADDYEALDAEQEEWSEHDEDADGAEADDLDPAALADELAALEAFLAQAEALTENTKGEALVRSLATALDQAEALGAARKAVVFTESRRTQAYLYRLLEARGYAGQVVMLNGSNTEPATRAVVERWQRRQGEARAAARGVDAKAALVEAFRGAEGDAGATILLATEAAAEGVNLQFCSLVVNYDLPWNPQRIEQRIGRCHRYGQRHEVVVLNLLNQRNAADRRVYALLSERLRLFEGVFGASDEVLGALESGVDIERRIAAVYQTCRSADEIDAAFDALQAELDAQIQDRMADTRQKVLDHFDQQVHQRLAVHQDAALAALDQRGQWLAALTRAELQAAAVWDPALPRFRYAGARAAAGWYNLDWKDAEARGERFYRVDDPLAAALVAEAKARALPLAWLHLDYSGHGAQIAVLKPLVGQQGWLTVALLSAAGLHTEEFLVISGCTDNGAVLDGEVGARLLSVAGRAGEAVDGPAPPLQAGLDAEVGRCLRQVAVRNARHFDAEVAKLSRWSDDLKLGLERDIKELDREIAEAQRQAALAIALADKLEAQRALRALEQKRTRKRRDLFQEQDRIDEERAALIEGIERQLATSPTLTPLFTVRWTLR